MDVTMDHVPQGLCGSIRLTDLVNRRVNNRGQQVPGGGYLFGKLVNRDEPDVVELEAGPFWGIFLRKLT